jgi:ATP/ADP translocase
VNNSEIQSGLPCVYEQLCYWTGIAVAVLFVGLIGAIIISVWQDKIKQQKKRKARRKRYYK